jgi:hypothetical protein
MGQLIRKETAVAEEQVVVVVEITFCHRMDSVMEISPLSDPIKIIARMLTMSLCKNMNEEMG